MYCPAEKIKRLMETGTNQSHVNKMNQNAGHINQLYNSPISLNQKSYSSGTFTGPFFGKIGVSSTPLMQPPANSVISSKSKSKTQQSSDSNKASSSGVSFSKKAISASFPIKSDANSVKSLSNLPDSEQDRDVKEINTPKHFIGTVEYVIQWYKIINQQIPAMSLFQAIGWLECVKRGSHPTQKLIFIRGESGAILQCVYYEMDMPMKKVIKGQIISCTGRMIGAIKLHAVHIELLKEEDRVGVNRAIFLSQRTISELYGKHM